MVDKMPIMFPEFEFIVLGEKNTTIFNIDTRNGSISTNTDNNTLTLIRTDYTLKAFDDKTNEALWNLTVSDIVLKNSTKGVDKARRKSVKYNNTLSNLDEDVYFAYLYRDHKPIKIYQKDTSLATTGFAVYFNVRGLIIMILILLTTTAMVLLIRVYRSNLALTHEISGLKQKLHMPDDLSTNFKTTSDVVTPSCYTPVFKDNFEGNYFTETNNLRELELDINNFGNMPLLHENFILKNGGAADTVSSVTECIVEEENNIIKKTELMKLVSFYKKERAVSYDNIGTENALTLARSKSRDNILNFRVKAQKVNNIYQFSVKRYKQESAIKELTDLYKNYINQQQLGGKHLHHEGHDYQGDVSSNDLLSDNGLFDTGRFNKNFESIELLDKGGFGSVYRARHKIDNNDYAVKVLKIKVPKGADIFELEELQEIKTMMKLEHKNVVRYITCWFEKGKKERRETIAEEGGFNWDSVDKYQSSKVNSRHIISNISSDASDIEFKPVSIAGKPGNAEKADPTNNDVVINKLTKESLHTIYFYMQIEYCKGLSLSYYFENRKSEPERNLGFLLFKQMLLAVNHIHQNNIIHRDIK
jgi:hypothetical protein